MTKFGTKLVFTCFIGMSVYNFYMLNKFSKEKTTTSNK